MDEKLIELVRKSCEIQNITSWVQRRRTEWSEHISRMADDRLVRTVRDGIPEGKRNEVDRRKDGETHWNKQATGLQEEKKKKRRRCVNVTNYMTYHIRSIVAVHGKKNCGDN